MSNYTSPVIVELGTIAEFTNNDFLAIAYDGKFFHGESSTPTPRTS